MQELRRHIVATRTGRRTGGAPPAGKSYPDTVREEGLRMVAEGVPIKEIARRLGTSLQTPRNWIIAAKKAAGGAAPKRRGGRRKARSAAVATVAAPAPAASNGMSSRDAKLLADIKSALRDYIASAGL